ncbi:MAG TPA: DUF3467 domain-containing protein [Candidatus Angelobacter sp.]|jgi:flagellar protein FlaG|nr:DUF3467 domain-containing protein [Candidatus Angelobacter sp.]
MTIPSQPNIRLINMPDYREGYANSVQVRVSVWDFLLVFGRLQQQTSSEVEVHNFQGIYLSPQQAKALVTILDQNIIQYEKTFGEIKLDPNMTPPGPIN